MGMLQRVLGPPSREWGIKVSFTLGTAYSDLIQTWPLTQNYAQLSAHG